ncbi:MAG: Ku protein [Leptospirales bacterium]|nr:Ku protein [Leptospirales bacterium]
MEHMMRSIWKGHIRFSLVTIPVRIYNAIETSENIKFNQLHRECNGRVGYDKKCKKCQQSLATADIVKGYEYEPDQYVVFEDSDFEKVKLKSTKVIEIEGFVDVNEVHPMLFESPYYAGPDGDVAAKSYSLLCQALKETGRVGVGKVILRDREDVVLLSPHEQGMALYRLRYPEEIRKITDVPQVDKLDTADKEQLKLARSLVDSMARPLAEIELKDNYKSAMKEIIDAKVAGKEIISMEEEPKPAVDIMTALRESIELAKSSKKGMVTATGKATKEETAKVAKETKSKKKKAG